MATVTTYSGTPVASSRIADDNARFYTGQQFTTTAAGSITSLKFWHRINDGTPTDGVKVSIWTDSSDSPGSMISGSEQTIAQASIVDGGNSYDAGEFTSVTFASPPPVTDATKYWVVMTRAGSIDAVNYNNVWTTSTSSYAGGINKGGSNVPVWGSALDQDQLYEITITATAFPKMMIF